MFKQDFVTSMKRFGVFILVYTVIFVLFFSTISYTIPFVLAFILALFTKPINKLLRKNIKLSPGWSALISTILVFSIIFLVLAAIIIKITSESKELLASLPDINTTAKYINMYTNKISSYFKNIDPALLTKFETQLSSALSNTFNITVKVINSLLSFAIGLPIILMIIFITLLSTYFFSKDMPGLQSKFLSIFSDDARSSVVNVWIESNRMISGYIKAYSIIVSLTFLQTLIGFLVLNVKYAAILSLICGAFDLLPILGIGAVYLPVVIIYFLSGNYFTAGGVAILYIVVSVVRQIVEPKILSSSLGLHPVAVLAAIFIGIKAYGFTGMLYLIFLMVFYNILKKVKLI